jgi:hypothetical protein
MSVIAQKIVALGLEASAELKDQALIWGLGPHGVLRD